MYLQKGTKLGGESISILPALTNFVSIGKIDESFEKFLTFTAVNYSLVASTIHGTAEEISFEWSHRRFSSTETNVRNTL